MWLTSKFNKGICFLLSAIDIFSRYAWIITLNDKKDNTIINAFQKVLDESNLKPNKMWVDKSCERFGLLNYFSKSENVCSVFYV